MHSRFTRLRFSAAVAAAFVGGVAIASAFDLTHFGYADTRTGSPVQLQSRPISNVGDLDTDQIQRLAGDEARNEAEHLKQLARVLEEAAARHEGGEIRFRADLGEAGVHRRPEQRHVGVGI